MDPSRRLKGHDNMESYLASFLLVIREIKDIGGTIDETLVKMTIARGLPVEYTHVLKADQLSNHGGRTLASFCDLLRQEALELASRQPRPRTSPTESPIALQVQGSKPGRRPNQQRRPEAKDKPYCKHCKVTGHTVEKCWAKDPSKRPPRRDKPAGKASTRTAKGSKGEAPTQSETYFALMARPRFEKDHLLDDDAGVRVGLAAYTDTDEVDRLLDGLAALV